MGQSQSSRFSPASDHRPSAQANMAFANSPFWHGASADREGHRNGAAQWGTRSKEFGGQGYYQLLFDDTDAQGRVQLRSSHAASELNLGHLVHAADNYRGSFRGSGAELRTDAYGALRAIADGEIVFARRPTAQVATLTHPLNYNPYGNTAAWTDDGLVIVRHETEIGDGANAQAIVFYSVVAQLAELRGNALKVAMGTATAAERKLFRKGEIGLPGKVYGATGHVHFEIVCVDVSLRKLVGRMTGQVPLAANGRSDAIYGELYFHIPAGTRCFADKPAGNIVAPTIAPVHTIAAPLIIGLRYGSGDGPGAQRGNSYLTTYRLDGSQIGTPIEDPNAEYDMFARADGISNAYPAEGRPAPSAVYELLRFGRIVNPDHATLAPADCPNWQRVNVDGGAGWLNVNAGAVRTFSDADFPHWRGWKLIDDDTNADSRCDSPQLYRIIEDASNADGRLSRAELERRMSLPAVQAALRRTICKLPSEWNRDSIDARWGWLQTDTEFQLTGDDWVRFRKHITALTVPSGSLPVPLRQAHWHFHPPDIHQPFQEVSMVECSRVQATGPEICDAAARRRLSVGSGQYQSDGGYVHRGNAAGWIE